MKCLRTLVERLVGWLLFKAWQKEGPRLNSNIAISVPAIGNVPLSSFVSLASLVPIVAAGMRAGKSSDQIMADLSAAAPAALIALSEALLNVIAPGAGTLEALIVWLIRNSKDSTMSQADVNAWMDRFSNNAINSG